MNILTNLMFIFSMLVKLIFDQLIYLAKYCKSKKHQCTNV